MYDTTLTAFKHVYQFFPMFEKPPASHHVLNYNEHVRGLRGMVSLCDLAHFLNEVGLWNKNDNVLNQDSQTNERIVLPNDPEQ